MKLRSRRELLGTAAMGVGLGPAVTTARLCRHIYRDTPEAKAGKIAIPVAPGLGFEPNRDAIRAITLKS